MWRHDVKTVGELIGILNELPSDTPLVALSSGHYSALKQGVSVYAGPVGSSSRSDEEKKRDVVPDGTIAVQIIHN